MGRVESSQHSRTRRADEAAHGDIDVSHPGLTALEAVLVDSRLGELPDLAGAYLLIIPVFSVRHTCPCFSPPPFSRVETNSGGGV